MVTRRTIGDNGFGHLRTGNNQGHLLDAPYIIARE